MVIGLAAAFVGVGIGLFGCDRSSNQTVVIPRKPEGPPPSTQEETKEADARIRSDLQPIPELGASVAVKRNNGEVWSKYSNGMMMYEVRPGSGIRPQVGQTVSVYYKGTFPDGTVFDQTKSDPFSFMLGTKGIIKGWNLALASMAVGGKRRIYLPAALAYGTEGHLPTIRGNQDLEFEIELVKIMGKPVEFPETQPAATLPAAPVMGPAAPATAPK
jgi:FKBP-type peptidyl-prolyl cis-trans isomerase